MRYMIIGGDHPRHLYYLNSIVESCNVVGAILEHREEFVPEVPLNLDKIDRENFIRHFQNRKKFELEYFGDERKLPKCPIHYVNEKNLYDEKSVEFVKKIKPDVVFIFGTGMIREPLYSNLPQLKINLHLGLSPRYRGSATLFWPFYFLEPNWAGSTFHIITNEPDAGDIIHQSIPILEKGDTIHEVACKVVKQSSIDVKKIISILESGKELQLYKQRGTGKKFLSRDFMPQHLRVIYNLYNDNIVDYFLEGKINPKNPNLIVLNQS
jgi:folate-dependent phosphoribosylglycinamide formyltransferase PurN